MSEPDLSGARKADVRWQLMRALEVGAPSMLNQSLLLTVIRALYPDANDREIRRELDYLEKRGLVKVDKGPDESGPWRAELTRDGFDVALYTATCDPGIARPPKYWKG